VFELRNLGFAYRPNQLVLKQITVQLPAAQFIALLGPNGAGKSTLLALMAGLRKHYQGSCCFAQRELRHWPRRDFARRVAIVLQGLHTDFPFTARQVAAMGRMPYAESLFESPADTAAIEQALAATDALEFADRDFRTLSGGEKQRVLLAAALAQSPDCLLLDEPATFLDLRHQVDLCRLLAAQARRGLLVVAATHDLNLAARWADRILLLEGGRLVADGPPHQVLTTARLEAVFQVRCRVLEPEPGLRWICYGD
jgi:iron complex transport system ATP-binding protein